MPITPKQQRFVDEYLLDLNASAAARRAGYRGDPNTVGPRLWAYVGIQAAITAAQQKRQARTEITQDMVLKELARVAFGNKRSLMKWGPDGVKLIDSAEITDDDAAMVSEVSETITEAGGSIKLKTHDKVKALELLGRHMGLFTDKVQLTGKDGGPLAHTAVTAEQLADAVRNVRDTY